MLDLFEQSTAAASAPGPTEGRDLPATLGERFESDWATNEASVNGIRQANLRNQAIREFSDQVSAAGGDVTGEYTRRLGVGPNDGGFEPDGLEVANAALAKLKASGRNPRLWLDPMTEDDIGKRSGEIRQQAIASGAEMQGREQTFASRLGGFLGATASSLNDPFNIPLMAVAPEESLGILGHAALFGAGAAVSQTANEAVNARFNEMVRPGYGARGEAAGAILGAGVGGAVLGGTLKAASDVLTRAFTGQWPTALRDAANVVKSEAQIQTTNVLPGVEGEAEHRAAVAGSVDQALKGRPIEPSPEAAPLFERHDAEIEQLLSRRLPEPIGGLGVPHPEGPEHFPAFMFNGRVWTGVEHADALDAAIKDLGIDSADEIDSQIGHRAMFGEVHRDGRFYPHEGEINDEGTIDERYAKPRGEVGPPITEPTGQAPYQGVVSIEFRGETYEGNTRLDAIRAAHQTTGVDMERISNEITPETTQASVDKFYEERRKSLEQGISDLAAKVGYDMPKDDASAIADRVRAAQTDDEARAILGQIADRPQTIAGTMLSPADIAADNRLAADAAPRPATIPTATMAETLASPETMNAMRADIERTIDEGAKAGKAPRIPIGVDADGEPIYGSVARAMNEVDGLNALADQIAACALPGAMQADG